MSDFSLLKLIIELRCLCGDLRKLEDEGGASLIKWEDAEDAFTYLFHVARDKVGVPEADLVECIERVLFGRAADDALRKRGIEIKPARLSNWPDSVQRAFVRLTRPDQSSLMSDLIRWLWEKHAEVAQRLELPKPVRAERATRRSGHDSPPIDATPSIDGFRSADSLSYDNGIRPQRLSEAASAGKVSTCQAPRCLLDSQGRRVRTLYNEAEALKHCSPKHVKERTRHKIGPNGR